ncbi:MAG: hypothetical protein ACYS1A_19295, partial [Planctomycetota bacterium]
MHKQLICLFSLIFVLGSVGNASAGYFLGDDFESYNSHNDLRNIWDPNGTASDETNVYYYLDITFVHTGTRSLRIWYDNSYSPYYCGVSRTFDTPADWTLIDTADGLSLW